MEATTNMMEMTTTTMTKKNTTTDMTEESVDVLTETRSTRCAKILLSQDLYAPRLNEDLRLAEPSSLLPAFKTHRSG